MNVGDPLLYLTDINRWIPGTFITQKGNRIKIFTQVGILWVHNSKIQYKTGV